ncbi:MAG: hypothetical protein HQK83_17560 [Fibrobacteria bacterium]|nr:hypothetical protein [Fibrobacteria bacterium]
MHKAKRTYSPPKVESEDVFEQNALACGKCRDIPMRQHGCMRFVGLS